MRVLALGVLFAGGCIGSIEPGTGDDDPLPPTDPAKDLVVGFTHASPIGVGQLGRHTIYDACTTEALCATQSVELMSVAIDRADVLTTTAVAGGSQFDVTAIAAGTASVSVMAQNTGVAAMDTKVVEVLVPDRFDLLPAERFVRTIDPKSVTVLHTCAAPITFQTSVVANFSYQLYAGLVGLRGSGFYPFTSAELTGVTPPDPGADGGIVRFAAGANATASTITSPLGPEIAINLVETVDGVVLSEQSKAPTTEQERLIWADGTAAGQPVCFDNTARTAISNTPAICTVVDSRDAGAQFKGPGPYQLNWLGAGTCSVTFQITGVGAPVTKEYQPLP